MSAVDIFVISGCALFVTVVATVFYLIGYGHGKLFIYRRITPVYDQIIREQVAEKHAKLKKKEAKERCRRLGNNPFQLKRF